MKLFWAKQSRALRWSIIALSVALFLLLLNQIVPMVWYSPLMTARLVAPDGKPVEGAIVLASWNIEGPWNGAPLGQLEMTEVVTDKDGRFEIPAWGPRFRWHGAIPIDEPTVRIFKPGYLPLVIKNYVDVPMTAADRIIRFRLQDQAITLTPFTGSLTEYETKMDALLMSMHNIGNSQDKFEACYWKRMPRLLLALQDLKEKLVSSGAGNNLHFAYLYGGDIAQQKCGNAKEFFRDYRNIHGAINQ